MVTKHIADQLNAEFNEKEIVETLKRIASQFPGKVVFTTSFGIEDQVITDYIFKNEIDIKVVTLDTGRLFEETYKVYNRTLEKYQKPIQPYYPKHDELESFVGEKGPNSFYLSVENRKQCCFIRKVEPLGRVLDGMECWITGIRASQSNNREDMLLFEWDGGHEIVKYNPLRDWSLEDCKAYVKENQVPYNVLHDRGFVSIGCSPCTRAIQPGEDFRAGRWWWERNSKKECGLHTHK
ncbi:phosphoadenylyl-sulfate reductase [uncultured Sunxiuqinia sp.]|uniref:phosphoadenylyl-sulfate reductase n=1 Tax=uncultured Sunxiuqinia sp. TaxID=1573825 RepID=UPI002AA8AC68|nr:phosphoadenylyl-sulfate reductase [uncultured Sunxiuqinia sp.]